MPRLTEVSDSDAEMLENTTNKIRNGTENHGTESGENLLLPTNISQANEESRSLVPYRRVGRKAETPESEPSEISSAAFKGWTLDASQSPSTDDSGLGSSMPNSSLLYAPTLPTSPKTSRLKPTLKRSKRLSPLTTPEPTAP